MPFVAVGAGFVPAAGQGCLEPMELPFPLWNPLSGIWRGVAHGSGLDFFFLKVCSSIHQAYLLLTILELILHGD